MNLDDAGYRRSLDSSNLIAAIDALPSAIAAAWAARTALDWPEHWRGVRQVVLAGMGPAGMAAEIAAERLRGICSVPVLTWQEFELPRAANAETLVIALSPEGDEEEAVSAAVAAEEQGAAVAALTRGGELAATAQANGWPVDDVIPNVRGQAAAGPLAVGVLGALTRLGLCPDLAAEVADAAVALSEQQNQLRAGSPVTSNPAKRMAGQLMDRVPLIFAAAPLAGIARHWKSQINVMAKAPAMAEAVPAMDHHTIAGTMHPEALIGKYMVVALRSTFTHPRAQWMVDQTRQVYLTAGFNTDAVEGTGATPLAHMLTALHYGEYAAFYLALCYGADPGA